MPIKSQPKFCFSLRVNPLVLDSIKKIMKSNKIKSRNEVISKAILVVAKENIIISDKIN